MVKVIGGEEDADVSGLDLDLLLTSPSISLKVLLVLNGETKSGLDGIDRSFGVVFLLLLLDIVYDCCWNIGAVIIKRLHMFVTHYVMRYKTRNVGG